MIRKILGSALEYGDKGKNVEDAQMLLQLAGSKIKVNGEFTIGMTTAVKAFQKRNKLKVTGVIDQKTWEKLLEYKKPEKKAPAKKTGGTKK